MFLLNFEFFPFKNLIKSVSPQKIIKEISLFKEDLKDFPFQYFEAIGLIIARKMFVRVTVLISVLGMCVTGTDIGITVVIFISLVFDYKISAIAKPRTVLGTALYGMLMLL